MPLNLELVGKRWNAGEHSWESADALLYALGVGAGAQDAATELPFTTENSTEIAQQVLPTFVVTVTGPKKLRPSLGNFDFSRVLHAEQAITLFESLPAEGRARIDSRVVGMYDKGKDALVVLESSITDVDSGRRIAETRRGLFIRGEGNFNGERGESAAWVLPKRPADHVVTYDTSIDQALLYRLSGDRNPLHSDPVIAARAGFERPILHGLCTYGFTGRALLHALCNSDPAAFGSMSVRFSAPVLPGQVLSVHIWDDGDVCRFVTKVGEVTVLDRGVFKRRSA